MRKKARLVAQGFSQVKGLDVGENFALVVCLEAIRIPLSFAASKGFKLFQMDVKSAFLNGIIQGEVYVRQPTGFKNLKYPSRVYKLSKALYCLKQAPRAWYARLKTFLLDHGYVIEQRYPDRVSQVSQNRNIDRQVDRVSQVTQASQNSSTDQQADRVSRVTQVSPNNSPDRRTDQVSRVNRVSQVGATEQKMRGSSQVANMERQVTQNSANTESRVTENSANTENRVMQDSGGRKLEEVRGAAPSKRLAPRSCPRGITMTQKTQITKDVSKRGGWEKGRGRAGLLV
jgi:hypothetical protein